MPTSESRRFATPLQTAGMMLAARPRAVAQGLDWPSVDEILAATNVDEASARLMEEVVNVLAEVVPTVVPAEPPTRFHAVMSEAFAFVMDHPGCLQHTTRVRCSTGYRQFVLELRTRYADMIASDFAEAVRVPLEMLEGWMRGGRRTQSTHAMKRRAP